MQIKSYILFQIRSASPTIKSSLEIKINKVSKILKIRPLEEIKIKTIDVIKTKFKKIHVFFCFLFPNFFEMDLNEVIKWESTQLN